MIFRPFRYSVTLIGISLLVAVLFYLIERFLGFSAGSGSGSAVAPLIAAMIEGQAYFKQAKEKPAASEMWKASVLMTVIAFAISLVVSFLFAAIFAPEVLRVIWQLGTGILVAVLVGVFVLHVLMSRLGYGLGVKTQAKVQT